ncbi:DUF6080 domain-containing protein [Paenibacillus sp. FSL K6-1566]|uniref:DUF6080 domain-containing protein n=1 Tax=Paenibacillus sp. FSL K6-1566 TaxID=2954515 RepID=UPI0031016FAA
MSFLSYLFRNKRDNYTAIGLAVCLAVLYFYMNIPFVSYIRDNAALLAPHNPFYGAPFQLNLFNFDPSMQYGPENVTIIHPLINFLTSTLTLLFGKSNLPFLIIQSILNACSAAILYYLIRRIGAGWLLAFIMAIFFGISSYTIFTALIPDSYAYAQFVIILSAAYLHYCRAQDRFSVPANATFGLLNFGITSTNVATFFGAFFISLFDRRRHSIWGRLLYTLLVFAALVAGATLIQYFVFSGKTWIGNVFSSMQSGAFSYVAPFSFAHHSRVFHMLLVSPILFPEMAMIDPGIAAFATDLTKPYPVYINIIGFGLLALAILAFVSGLRTWNAWAFIVYIMFGILLHVVVGFGLATYSYDLYLYAGHYLFAIFVLAAMLISKLHQGLVKQLLTGVMIVFMLVTLVHNIALHHQTLDYIQTTYETVLQTPEP